MNEVSHQSLSSFKLTIKQQTFVSKIKYLSLNHKIRLKVQWGCLQTSKF